MKPNETLDFVKKADMAVSDLTSGGVLLPEQMQNFLKVAITGTVAMSRVTVTTINGPTAEIDKLTTMGRVLQPAVESQALAVAQRSKPGFDKVSIVTKEAIGECPIPRQALEDQIERGVFQSSVTSYMAEHVKKDIEDLMINGDTGGTGDAWLLYLDGLLKQTTTYTVAGGAVTLNKGILRDMLATMPEQFSNQPNLEFWTNRKARNDYVSSLTDRATPMGDAAIAGQPGVFGYDGVPLNKIPLFPNNLSGGTKTNVLLLDPKNAILAFSRQMTVDTEYRPSQRVYNIVMTLRLDTKYQHEPMCVKATNIVGQ